MNNNIWVLQILDYDRGISNLNAWVFRNKNDAIYKINDSSRNYILYVKNNDFFQHKQQFREWRSNIIDKLDTFVNIDIESINSIDESAQTVLVVPAYLRRQFTLSYQELL